MMLWTFAVPALELALLLLAALLNQKVGTRWVKYRKFELIGLVVLWYLVLLGGVLIGGSGGD